MDNRESPTIDVANMDPALYKAASEDDIWRSAGVAKSIQTLTRFAEANDLTLCLTPQRNTVLHIAVEFGHQNIVEKVIQLCPSLISQHNSKGDTPLHVAARAGHLGLTQLLTPALNLEEGNPTLEEGNPVRHAGSVVLRMRNLEGNNPIHEALKKSHGEVALHLLAYEERHELACEVNVAEESLLYLAAEAGLDEVVQKIIDGGDYSTRGPDGQNPLHIAVIKGRSGVVKILLDKESKFIPQADRFGNTVLHYASAKSYCRVLEDKDKDHPWTQADDQKKILELLLEDNPSLAYIPNINGDYPLFIAIKNDFGLAVDTILDRCPDSAELVNQKGQNALHLAVMEKNEYIIYRLMHRSECKKLINEPDDDGNTPMHLATLTNQEKIVKLLTRKGTVDLTMSNKGGLTAMDICGYTKTKHPIRNTLRKYGAVPSRHRWQQLFPSSGINKVEISPEFKEAIKTLPVVTVLVATVTFAAAFTVPGGYRNDGPSEGLPVFMRNAALQAFVLSDILAFFSSMAATVLLVYANAHSEDAFKVQSALKTCYNISGVAILATIIAFLTAVSMAATILLVYANARSEDAFKINYVLKTCYYISGVAILATIIAFVTAMYVLTSKESLWLAVISLILDAIDAILDHCPDSAELVYQKGQNALHLALMEKNRHTIYWLAKRLEFKKLINEPNNDGNTPMHLVTLTNQKEMVEPLIHRGPADLTMSNKEGLTAMDICGYMETEAYEMVLSPAGQLYYGVKY
ncbi:hypothetical protein MRB53_021222 [Persea americana]|uniref:Uncharacterized protein n=1 Tax=Persea americana TaxID=3435 RepID=A0ACC2L3B5_PERAE|nr:hypothetical protein MRB53_021222 [Persea americana]